MGNANCSNCDFGEIVELVVELLLKVSDRFWERLEANW